MSILERASKAAATASVLLILLLLLAVHPDVTPILATVGGAALALGWSTGNSRNGRIHLWLLLAPIVPAIQHVFTGREGTVLDLIWMAGLAGFLLRGGDWWGWNLPNSWRVLLGAWALTLSLAWPVLVAREIGFDLRGLYDVGAINSWAMRSAPHVVTWTLYVVLTQLLGVLWLDWLVARFAEAPDRALRVAHGLWIGVTLASVVAIYQGIVDLGFVSTPAWASLGRATGTMLDANAYGVLAALAGPVAFVLMRSSKMSTGAGIAVLAVNLLGMWMSGSRTALLTGIAGVLALALVTLRQPSSQRTRVAVGSLAAVVVLIVVLAATAVGPWRRVVEVPLTRAGASLIIDRGPYGPIAMQMIREHPLTGVGVGFYHVLAPDYWRVTANDLLPWDNAQNWWRHQASELGLLGALPIVLWSVLVGWRVIAGRAQGNPDAGIVVRGLLVGLALASLLGMPTQNPAVLLWFFFLVAWLTSLTDERGMHWATNAPATTVGAVLAMLIAVGYAWGHVDLARSELSVAERAKRTARDYVAGAHEPEPLPTGNLFRWTDDESRFVLAAKTRWLVIRVRAEHPDIATRPIRVSIATRCQTLFDEELNSRQSISLGLELPEGTAAIDLSVRASRTWRPASYGAADTRDIGAGIVADFVASREQGLAQNRVANVRECPL